MQDRESQRFLSRQPMGLRPNCCHAVCRSAISVLLVLPFLVFGMGRAAIAADVSVGKIEVSGPWSRATPGGARVGAGYLTIRNLGGKADRLVSGTAEIAERVEVHAMRVTDGIMRMRRLTKGLEIGPSATIEFKPGGYHFMFVGLKRPIVKGESIRASLVFENAGKVEITFVAQGIGSPGPK